MSLIELLIISLIILAIVVIGAYATHWLEILGKILKYKVDKNTDVDLGTEGHHKENDQNTD